MTFDKYIRTTLSKEDYEQLEKYLGCSPHRKTKILRNPPMANNREILLLASLLETSAIELIEEYQLGKDQLAPIEVENHREFNSIKMKLNNSTP